MGGSGAMEFELSRQSSRSLRQRKERKARAVANSIGPQTVAFRVDFVMRKHDPLEQLSLTWMGEFPVVLHTLPLVGIA
ncbi:MAG: hypothetical protein SynsKO_21350 [Synoicihabitans sp.]